MQRIFVSFSTFFSLKPTILLGIYLNILVVQVRKQMLLVLVEMISSGTWHYVTTRIYFLLNFVCESWLPWGRKCFPSLPSVLSPPSLNKLNNHNVKNAVPLPGRKKWDIRASAALVVQYSLPQASHHSNQMQPPPSGFSRIAIQRRLIFNHWFCTITHHFVLNS